MSFVALATLTTALVITPLARSPHPTASRSGVASMQIPGPAQDVVDAPTPAEAMVTWRSTSGGLKYVDERIGTGLSLSSNSVVSVHYTVSFQQSGMVFGTSRNAQPVTFAPAKYNVPVFNEAIEGMRVGGQRRLTIPASKIPRTQMQNVPQDQAGEDLRFEIEVVGIETGVKALIPSLLPPGNRRMVILRALFALSFLPYLLPEELKPDMWKFGDVSEIAARHQAAADSLFLGGAAVPLDSLFQ